MVALSVTVETFKGLTWPAWKQLVSTIERLGFAGMFCCDHLPPDVPSTIDMVVGLTYLADHTERIHFGPLVAPISFRDPVILAHQAAALDALSQGRMILGLGSGSDEREHATFGYKLGDVATRATRFEEGVAVIAQLLRSHEPTSFDGQHFRLQDARLLTQPSQPLRPLILLGGNGPKRTLPLVARYADVWNALYLAAADFANLSGVLDTLLYTQGRPTTAVKRTLLWWPIVGRNVQEIEHRIEWVRRDPNFTSLAHDELLDQLRSFNAFIGTPDEVITQIRAYETAGVQEIMIQWFDANDLEGLRIIAEDILPFV
jgi:alkanesulfonate monooxygenase SsuD/methylene tetrahydromethanopterin reductase-like flavin-dependent oxidoreductase (luciferase family)